MRLQQFLYDKKTVFFIYKYNFSLFIFIDKCIILIYYIYKSNKYRIYITAIEISSKYMKKLTLNMI